MGSKIVIAPLFPRKRYTNPASPRTYINMGRSRSYGSVSIALDLLGAACELGDLPLGTFCIELWTRSELMRPSCTIPAIHGFTACGRCEGRVMDHTSGRKRLFSSPQYTDAEITTHVIDLVMASRYYHHAQ